MGSRGRVLEKSFREFCNTILPDDAQIATLIMYSDAQRSLVRLCTDLNIQHRHPPPGRAQANAVAERKVGVALAGIRCYLANAGLPCCFWPFAGHCFAFNDSWSTHDGDRIPPRKLTLGNDCEYDLFTLGQLVMFKPAPTIYKRAKTEPRLVPGIFLDYYTASGGFTGQYICCHLTDFCS